MELHELQALDLSTGLEGHSDAESESGGGIGRPLPQLAGAAGCEQHRAGTDVAAPSGGDIEYLDADAPAGFVEQQVGDPRLFGNARRTAAKALAQGTADGGPGAIPSGVGNARM